jgi:hypothetical protein
MSLYNDCYDCGRPFGLLLSFFVFAESKNIIQAIGGGRVDRLCFNCFRNRLINDKPKRGKNDYVTKAVIDPGT